MKMPNEIKAGVVVLAAIELTLRGRSVLGWVGAVAFVATI